MKSLITFCITIIFILLSLTLNMVSAQSLWLHQNSERLLIFMACIFSMIMRDLLYEIREYFYIQSTKEHCWKAYKMKTKEMLFIFMLLSGPELFSQTPSDAGWQWQYPKPQGNTLYDIYVFNKDTAIAVGDYGTIIKTTDGGKNWSVKYHLCDMDYLFKIYFIDNSTGFVAGGKAILKTEDGGENWNILITDTTKYGYHCLYFANKDSGLVFGTGQILKTTDGGKSWRRTFITQFDDIPSFQSVSFVDSQTGCAVADGFYGNEIYKTTDGGNTWNQLTNIEPKIYGSRNAYFMNKNIGWVVGLGGVIKTTDGGQSWTYQRGGISGCFYGIHFINADSGWVVGSENNSGIVITTSDGGATWEEQGTNITGGLSSIDYNDGVGWTVGLGGVIYRTTDGGKSWISQRDEVYHFNSIYFVNENRGWAVGGWVATDSSIVFHTTNGGRNWEIQYNVGTGLNSVFALNENIVWAVGGGNTAGGDMKQSVLIYTQNGGINWNKKDVLQKTYWFSSIKFTNDSTGWITGTEGTLLKTTNRGDTWEQKYSSSNGTLNKLQFINENTGWAAYYSDILLKTTNSGETWTSCVIDTNPSRISFHFVNANLGWAVGDYYENDNIFRTTDGGNNWIPCASTYRGYGFSIYFVNETTGWIAGYNYSNQKTIIKTTDGGNTWSEQVIPTSWITDLYFLDKNIGWAIGNGIFKTTNGGGIVSVENESELKKNLPTQIELYQNYPNPFNPTTVIKYRLTKPSNVTLSIYDILGRHIKKLVDKWQPPGEYNITWQTGGLSSGVYFYMLRVGEFSQTKKMLLIR